MPPSSSTSSSLCCCDMGIFDFFRSRSSRRSSLSNKNGSNANADVPASASGASHSSNSTYNGAPAEVTKPPATAPAASKAPVATSLDSAATTASVGSNNNNNNDEDEEGDSSDNELKSPAPVNLGSIQNYEIVKELGRGATAVVQLGKQKDGEQLVALKVFKTSLLKKMREVKRVGRKMVVSTALDKVQVEIAIMKKLKHMNLLNLLEVFDDDSETLVLMLEYAPLGQIMHWDANERVYKATNDQIVAGGSTLFQEDELRNCTRQLLLGLEYLHENNICHRDLKPENILVSGDGVYKIADFGVAHLFDETKEAAAAAAANCGSDNQLASPEKKKGYVSSTAGTYAFMAPETLKGGAYDAYAADVWALGITLHALVLGRIPFYNPDVVALFEQIESNPIILETADNNNNEGTGMSSELAEFLYGLLEKDPEKRWSLAQCKQSPWLLEGLDEASKNVFLNTKYEQVTVNSEDVMNAVTKVSSFNVLLRVKIGANRWLRRAQKSSDERRRASMNSDDFSRSAPTSMNSVDESPESPESPEMEKKHDVKALSDNQAEI